jgi:hypothetical protein
MSAEKNPPLPAELKPFLKKHRSLSLLSCGTKLRCSLTGHEMKACAAAVAPYVSGARYTKARKWYSRSFASYLTPELLPLAEEWLRPHKDSDKLLFCALTRRAVNKIPEKVISHLFSRRFLRFLELHKEGKPVPVVEADGEGEDEEGEEEEEEGGGEERGGGSGGRNVSADDDLDAGWVAMEEAAAAAEEEAQEEAAAAAGSGGKGKRRFDAAAQGGGGGGGVAGAKKKK